MKLRLILTKELRDISIPIWLGDGNILTFIDNTLFIPIDKKESNYLAIRDMLEVFGISRDNMMPNTDNGMRIYLENKVSFYLAPHLTNK